MHGLKLAHSKRKLFQSSVKYFVHVIPVSGIEPDQEKQVLLLPGQCLQIPESLGLLHIIGDLCKDIQL